MTLAAPGEVHAATIQLSVATRIVVGPSSMRVEIDLVNSGDEPARQVVPSVEFQTHVLAGDAVASLEPAAPHTVAVEVPFSVGRPRGRWPVLVRVAYADGAGRVFDAIHVDVAAFDGALPASPLRINLPDVSLASTADVAVTLERAGVGQPVRVAFAAPAGVTVTPSVVVLERADRSGVQIQLANLGATVGSRLPVVALAEWDTESGRQVATAVSMVVITAADDGRPLVVVILAVVATAAVTAASVVRRRRRRLQA